MAKTYLLSALLSITLLLAPTAIASTCPSGGVDAVSGQLTINSQGQVPLEFGTDIQCYNYTLPYVFDCAPSVAIGTNELIQRPTIFKAHPQTICFSPSKLLTLIVTELCPSLLELTGDILDGVKYHSTSWLKIQIESLLATTKLIPPPSPPASLVNKSSPTSLPPAKATTGKP